MMEDQALFSLLMANYNNGKFIECAINSVLKQTYTNWEIILIDDCSTDNSREIYKKYESENRIKIFFNDQNSGVGFTYNRAAKLANGAFGGVLDPDDALACDDALAIMVKHHLFYKDSGVICSRHNVCNEAMKILWCSGVRDKNPALNYLTDREHNAEHFITYKAEVYRQTEGFNPTYRNAIDQEFYYRMEEVTTISFVDDILYNYRLVSNGLTLQSYKALYWHVDAIIEACKRRGINPEDIVGKLFEQVVKPHKEKTEKVLGSDYYRLGYRILAPMKKIKRKILN